MHIINIYSIVNFSLALIISLLIFISNSSASEADWSTEKINRSIREKLNFYNQSFPEIQFEYLENKGWAKSQQELQLFIGNQATNLDYEHPAELRKELLFVTIEKIRLMLMYGIPSSSLFKTAEKSTSNRKHVCVITLDPESNVATNKIATSYFIDLPENVLSSLSQEKYLDKKQHLDFIIDHEAFHCLDTFYFGGIPMSEKTFSTPYSGFKRESQADMFAAAMHIQRQRKITTYINNLIMTRGISLLNGETQHYSVEAIQLITNADISKIISSQPGELVSMVKNTYKTIAPDYKEYMAYRTAAVDAIAMLGIKLIEPPECSDNSEIADNNRVKELVDQTYHYYQLYIGKQYWPPSQ